MFGRTKKSKVNVAVFAYDAWGDEKLQRKTEGKIAKAIYAGADANGTDHRGWSALHWAAEYDWPTLVTVMIESERFPPSEETDIDMRAGLGGRTPLMLAVMRGHMDVVSTLLQHGADLDVVYENMTAVDMAIENEDEDVYELLAAFQPELVDFPEDSSDEDDDLPEDAQRGIAEEDNDDNMGANAVNLAPIAVQQDDPAALPLHEVPPHPGQKKTKRRGLRRQKAIK